MKKPPERTDPQKLDIKSNQGGSFYEQVQFAVQIKSSLRAFKARGLKKPGQALFNQHLRYP